MIDGYKTVKDTGTGEYEEKKSRFIATLCHVETEEAAICFINDMKKKYWDARHNCSAYIIGADMTIQRCSDDGEPSRTAGVPMLDILKNYGLTDVVCVVTRYFGGVLLGTGGLVRAYQQATIEGINGSTVLSRALLNKVRISTDYSGYGKLQYLLGQEGIEIISSDFAENVAVSFYCDDIQYGAVSKKMTEATSGKCEIEIITKEYVTVL